MSGLFFQPVDLHLQLADLMVQPVLFGFTLRRRAILPTAEDFRLGCLRPLLPDVNLARMDIVFRGDLVDCLLPLQRFQRHLRFELFALLLTFHLDTPFAQSLYLKVLSQIRGPL